MNELEYKVVKAIFSVKNISQVESVKMSEEELKNNSAELENMLKNLSEEQKAKIKTQSNPLFAKPNKQQKKSEPKTDKKRIRV